MFLVACFPKAKRHAKRVNEKMVNSFFFWYIEKRSCLH